MNVEKTFLIAFCFFGAGVYLEMMDSGIKRIRNQEMEIIAPTPEEDKYDLQFEWH